MKPACDHGETVLSPSAREVLYSSASIPLPSMERAVDGHRETLAWQRNGGKGISIDGDALGYNGSRPFVLVIFAADCLKMFKLQSPATSPRNFEHGRRLR